MIFFIAKLLKFVENPPVMKTLIPLVALAVIPVTHAATVNLGTEGFTIPGNNWPGGEPPSKAIDGLAGKYLNFGQENTGIVVTPAAGQAPTSITAWAANDSPERDPASFWLGGTNGDSLTGAYTFIAGGLLALPDTRSGGGADELLESNSATASFTNSATFTNYLVVFPTLKNREQQIACRLLTFSSSTQPTMASSPLRTPFLECRWKAHWCLSHPLVFSH